jgi:hypothetical protein
MQAGSAAAFSKLFENRVRGSWRTALLVPQGRVRGSIEGVRIQRTLPETAQDCEKSH